MKFSSSITGLIVVAASFLATAASAQQQPTGVWIDHTGRGAVEIKPCGEALCGHVVWIKDAKNKSACRTQIIGNVRQVGAGTWDRGWIVDPDDNSRYSVELKPVGPDRLRVTGYMGSKLFSETMTWRRAPADLQRCDQVDVAKPAAPAAPTPQVAAVPSAPTSIEPLPSRPTIEAPRPIEAAPLPQRQVTAPPQVLPTPEPAPAVVLPPQPRIAQPAPTVTEPEPAPAAEADPEEDAQPQRKQRRQANSRRKGGSRDCTLDLPYITVKYPCDLF